MNPLNGQSSSSSQIKPDGIAPSGAVPASASGVENQPAVKESILQPAAGSFKQLGNDFGNAPPDLSNHRGSVGSISSKPDVPANALNVIARGGARAEDRDEPEYMSDHEEEFENRIGVAGAVPGVDVEEIEEFEAEDEDMGQAGAEDVQMGHPVPENVVISVEADNPDAEMVVHIEPEHGAAAGGVSIDIREDIPAAALSQIQGIVNYGKAQADGDTSTQSILKEMMKKLEAAGIKPPPSFTVTAELVGDPKEDISATGEVFYKTEMKFIICKGSTPIPDATLTRSISTNEHSVGKQKPDIKQAIASLINYKNTVLSLANASGGSGLSALFEEPISDSDYKALMSSASFKMTYVHDLNNRATTVKSISAGKITLNYKMAAKETVYSQRGAFGTVEHYKDDARFSKLIDLEKVPKFTGDEKDVKAFLDYAKPLLDDLKKDADKFDELKKSFKGNRAELERTLKEMAKETPEEIPVFDLFKSEKGVREAVESYSAICDLKSLLETNQRKLGGLRDELITPNAAGEEKYTAIRGLPAKHLTGNLFSYRKNVEKVLNDAIEKNGKKINEITEFLGQIDDKLKVLNKNVEKAKVKIEQDVSAGGNLGREEAAAEAAA